MCPGVLGLWVHGWICTSVDNCQWGLWACCSSSLGLLHCGYWVVAQGLSFALLWGGCGSPGGGPAGVPMLWGALGCLWLRISSVSVSGPGGQVCGSSYSLLHIFIEKPYIHKRAHTPKGVWIQVLTDVNTSCIH
ncbi:hypothetical protein ILYODFUR_014517 [Ilyodon furcidens]|uniref:Uncharacterized protein n=1 Tax=Ilyodon furcidens TaxID=33524 RepID=A0ABV0VGE6_9TELE